MATKATTAAKAASAAKAAAGKAVQAARAAQAARSTSTTRAKAGPSGPCDYDAIVVGGGHNGLTAAADLARSGARTLVLEGRNSTGGAATTEAPWPDAPDFKVTRLSYVMSLLPPTIINDLSLERHGYKIYPMGPYYQAFPEGGSIKLYADDARRNHEEVSRWSKQDADASHASLIQDDDLIRVHDRAYPLSNDEHGSIKDFFFQCRAQSGVGFKIQR